MGLLENAIREHLELKRRRGADPHEVEREEQEALQPINVGDVPAWAAAPAQGDPTPFDRDALLEASAQTDASASLEASVTLEESAHVYAPGPAEAPAQEASAVELEQETAELDMSTVIAQAEDEQPASEQGAASPFRARRIVPGEGLDLIDDDLEWEVPQRDQPPAASQEHAPQGSFALE